MKKVILGILFFSLILFPLVSAIDLEVQKVSSNEFLVLGTGDPATFKINITNNGPTDNFHIYSLFAGGITPMESFKIKSGETKEVTFYLHPREDLHLRKYVLFEYYIQSSKGEEIKEELIVNIIDLEDAFEISAGKIDPESKYTDIYVYNKVNFYFSDLDFEFNSAFFKTSGSFDLGPSEKKSVKVSLNKKDFSSLGAGFYSINALLKVKDSEVELEGKLEFEEKSLISTREQNYGFFILTQIQEKSNEGNIPLPAVITAKKNIFSRLFTTFSIEPDFVERQGSKIYYTWVQELNPGEKLEVKTKTNWFLPFAVILFLILVWYLTDKYSKRDLLIKKKVNFVNAKGGEFGLKVSIILEANDHLENVKIIDRLPPLVDVYNHFGGEIPKRFHKGSKIFEWEFDRLEPGEKRILSYIIYSKVGVLGKFALPRTKGTYKKDRKSKEVDSNMAYFLAQSKPRE